MQIFGDRHQALPAHGIGRAREQHLDLKIVKLRRLFGQIAAGLEVEVLKEIGGKLLGERGMGDVLVTVGGIIPDDDVPALRAAGVAEIFGPGTTIAQVAEFLRANARPRD